MAEDTARALGASDGEDPIIIDGVECEVRPLGLKELTELERTCVEEYKRNYLKTFADNMDLLDPSDRVAMMHKTMETVAKWDLTDLPYKFAFDMYSLVLTDELRQWLMDEWDYDPETWPVAARPPVEKHLLVSALDGGDLSEEEYIRRSGGEKPRKVKVPYVQWWITGSYSGRMGMISKSFGGKVTTEQIIKELKDKPALLSKVSKKIELLSVPQVKNG